MACLMPNNEYYDEQQIFQYALEGRVRKIQKILDTDKTFPVDIINGEGQSLLYVSCLYRRVKVAHMLLQYGADPNKRCDDGSTPTHAAAYSCSVELLRLVVEEYGGDMRLHDKFSRTPKEWAVRAGKRISKKVLQLIRTWQAAVDEGLLSELNKGKHCSHLYPQVFSKSRENVLFRNDMQVDYHGYGDFLCCPKRKSNDVRCIGVPAVLPLASPTQFTSSHNSSIFRTPPGFMLEEALWRGNKVTIKRSKCKSNLLIRSTEDLLIAEAKMSRHLRHPNLLLLMSVCLTSTVGSYTRMPCHWLVYEPVKYGSLYHALHKNDTDISLTDKATLLIQIAKAVSYLHGRGFVHCVLTSHAIYLTDVLVAKLGDLFHICSSNDKVGPVGTIASCFNRWIAPEIILNKPVTSAADIYSFCVVVSEAFSGVLPWTGCDNSKIEQHIRNRRNYSMVPDWIPNSLRCIFQQGLKFSSHSRLSDIHHVLNCLTSLLESSDLEKLEGIACGEKSSKCHMFNKSERKLSAEKLDASKKMHTHISEEEMECLPRGIDVPDAKPTAVYKVQRASIPRILSENGASVQDCDLVQPNNRFSNYQASPARYELEKCYKPTDFNSNILLGRPHSCIPVRNNAVFVEKLTASNSGFCVSCPDVYNTENPFLLSDVGQVDVPSTNFRSIDSESFQNRISVSPAAHVVYTSKVSRATNTDFKFSVLPSDIQNIVEKSEKSRASGPPSSRYIPEYHNYNIVDYCQKDDGCPEYDTVCKGNFEQVDMCNADDVPDSKSQFLYPQHEPQTNGFHSVNGQHFLNQSETCIPTVHQHTLGVARSYSLPPMHGVRKIKSGNMKICDSEYDIEGDDLEEIFKGFANRHIDTHKSTQTQNFIIYNPISEMHYINSIEEASQTDHFRSLSPPPVFQHQYCQTVAMNEQPNVSFISINGCNNDEPIKETFYKDYELHRTLESMQLAPNLKFYNNDDTDSPMEENGSPFITCVEGQVANSNETSQLKENLNSNAIAMERGIYSLSLSADALEHENADGNIQGNIKLTSPCLQISPTNTEVSQGVLDRQFHEIKPKSLTPPFTIDEFNGSRQEYEVGSTTSIKPGDFLPNSSNVNTNLSSTSRKNDEAGESTIDSKYFHEEYETPKNTFTSQKLKVLKISEDEAEGVKTPSKWSFEKKLSIFKVVSDTDKELQQGNSVLARGTKFGYNGKVTNRFIPGMAYDNDTTADDGDTNSTSINSKHIEAFSSVVSKANLPNPNDFASDFQTSTPVSQCEYFDKPKGVQCRETETPRSFADVRAEIEAASSPINPNKRSGEKPKNFCNLDQPRDISNGKVVEKVLPCDSHVNVIHPALDIDSKQSNTSDKEPISVVGCEKHKEYIQGVVRQIVDEVFCVINTKSVLANHKLNTLSEDHKSPNMHIDKDDVVNSASYINQEPDITGLPDIDSPSIIFKRSTDEQSKGVNHLSRSLPAKLDNECRFSPRRIIPNTLHLGAPMFPRESAGSTTAEDAQEFTSMISNTSTSQAYQCYRSVDTSIWSV